ncbi:MAG: PHP domain-containing protein, partial [Candidatus Dormiibacterota bacterium]
HSDHSLLGRLSRVAQLVGPAKELGMPAIALTDHGTLSGAVPLLTEAAKGGIKPIIQDLVARTLGPCRWCCTARARQPLFLCRLAPEFGTMQRLSRR